MREFIDIVKTALFEAKTTEIEHRGQSVRVWINPSASDVIRLTQRFGELRGTIADDGTVFIWKAYDIIHRDCRYALKNAGLLEWPSSDRMDFIVAAASPSTDDWDLGSWSNAETEGIGHGVSIFMSDNYEARESYPNFERLFQATSV